MSSIESLRKNMLQHHVDIRDWHLELTAMGGYTASCYVDWNVVHSPMNTVIEMLEELKQVEFRYIEAFAEADITDNSMPYRNLLEDISKIYYLVDEIQYDSLVFHPQILHEPWEDRYRIHPGSGRAIATWLCEYEQFRTIYTHFNEPCFKPPGHTIRHADWKDFAKEIMFFDSLVGRSFRDININIEVYSAFPVHVFEEAVMLRKDPNWNPPIARSKPWKFINYSEGNFLNYKRDWRVYAYTAWEEAQHSIMQLGSTIFEFKHDYVVRVIRNDKQHNILTDN